MTKALFISDLHGCMEKYEFLFESIRKELPAVVFLGGDLLGFGGCDKCSVIPASHNFFYDYLVVELKKLKFELKNKYPAIFVILGNDDSKKYETTLQEIPFIGLLNYVHKRRIKFQDFTIVGYSYIPPTPFLNKDWEKYDVSRFVDVGCVSPEEGYRSKPVSIQNLRYFTIKRDLEIIFNNKLEMSKTICLFHSPPYQTKLDRAALDGKLVDHVQMDVHVGSIAIKEFILEKSPFITLHGHIHESTRITGTWKENIGNTICIQGASEHDNPALIIFDLENPDIAKRVIL